MNTHTDNKTASAPNAQDHEKAEAGKAANPKAYEIWFRTPAVSWQDAVELASAQPENVREFNFSEVEKQAAQIIDQLCPVFLDRTKAHVGPDTFKALTLRLAEMLEPLLAQRDELLAAAKYYQLRANRNLLGKEQEHHILAITNAERGAQ